MIGLNHHGFYATASDPPSCLQVERYHYLTRYAAQIVLLCFSAAVWFCMYVNFFGVRCYRVDFHLRQYDRTWSKMPRTSFRSDGNISCTQWSTNEIPSSTSKTRLSCTPNQGHIRRSPVRTKTGSITSTDTISPFAVHNGGDSIMFIYFIYSGGRKSLFTPLRPPPASARFAIVSISFDKILADIRT